MADLAKIFKAYDIRGIVPKELDEATVQAIGAAFVRVTGATAIVTAHDMRDSSPPLATAFANGAAGQGADVIQAGLGSTDLLYYASGSLDLPGAMFTASHNPAEYNGLKLCRSGARPIGQDTGLAEIRELVESGVPAYDGEFGEITRRDLLDGYAGYLKSLVDLSGIRPLKVAVDAGNGMGGHTVPTVFAGLPVELVPLYFELDGSFPNHEANPIKAENIRDLQAKVKETGADIGLAFDGDADRCFVVDERGAAVSPSAITALVAARELAKYPGANIVYNLICSRAVPEVIKEHGGTPVRTRVGHSFIKQTMAETGAVFGGEHSAHYYFRDFWFADSGMLAALHVLAALGGHREVGRGGPGRSAGSAETVGGVGRSGETGREKQVERNTAPLSAMIREYDRYAGSGEINSEVSDQAGTTAKVKAAFAGRPGATIDELDGLTVGTGDWWFNLRPSNTEPVLRLNVEANDEPTMAAVRDEVLAIVRGG